MKLIFCLLLLNIVLIAQENHRLLIDERSNKPMLVGTCQREALQDPSFSGWFNSEYENYKVKKEPPIVEASFQISNYFEDSSLR